MEEPHPVRGYRFGVFEAELASEELRKHGLLLRVQGQPFQVLVALLERPGEVVTREELRRRLWPNGTFVEFDRNLNTAINRLREALNDSADTPRFIETLPRRGYRFLAPVEVISKGKADPSPAPRLRLRTWALLAASLSVVVAVGWWLLPTPVPFQARDTVLIANFENRTGEPVFDGTLEHALERELSNSQFVSIASRERVGDALRLMKKPANSPIDPELGREVCLRDGGIRVLLTGRVEKLDSTYLLSAALVRPADGAILSSLSVEASGQRDVIRALRDLSNRVRSKLGEDLPFIEETQGKLAKVTTPSLRALQLYSQADAAMVGVAGGRNMALAEQLLRQAVAEDSEFASAYIHLAWAIRNQRKPESDWRPFSERALRLAGKTSERERYFILGSHFYLVGEWEKAVAPFEALLVLAPDHYWGYRNLLVLYEQDFRGPEDAVLFKVRHAEARPNDFVSNAAAWAALTELGGDPERARYFLLRARQLPPPQIPFRSAYDPPLQVKLATAYEAWQDADPVQVLAALDRISKTEDANQSIALHRSYLALGKRRAAEKAIEAFRGRGFLGVELDSGRFKYEKRKQAQLFDEWAPKQPPTPQMATGNLISMGQFALEVGRVALAEQYLSMTEKLEREGTRPELRSPRVLARKKVLMGQIAIARGMDATGIPMLREAIQDFQRLRRFDSLYPAAESLALALERQGDRDGAIQTLEHLPRAPLLNALGWMHTQLCLAELYHRAGRSQDAQKTEKALRSRLAHADPDFPMLVELNHLSASFFSASGVSSKE